ncbi:acyl carrier protein [Amycolatopsis sp. EV170708-02-1]|uniref:acyl carrier protein n=1 Tax=Amycolatopsis sp. EV170708-02-1 TaxID=2919322 RepID=UPI001F0BC731|nr:phosphopantetheine-binding protein [Amycolatopsis sp. EV170708-02-1]UMP06742.1 phosphopantetheine-binding protein [Amycolatopsis sp. EV170708-02-1]
MNENFRRLARVLDRWSTVAGEDITPQSEIDDGLDIDSLTRLEVVLAMNKEFGHTFDDVDVLEAKTVSDLLKLVPVSG